MIDFVETDFHIPEIKRESKLFNMATMNKYVVYGLRPKDNPPILIEYNADDATNDFRERLERLVAFFKSNGIQLDIQDEYVDEKNRHKVAIGIRRDIRSVVNKNKKPLFASSILSTIIYALEGRVDVEQLKKYKLKNLPKFIPSNPTPTA